MGHHSGCGLGALWWVWSLFWPVGVPGRCGVGREGRPCPCIRAGAAGLVLVGF